MWGIALRCIPVQKKTVGNDETLTVHVYFLNFVIIFILFFKLQYEVVLKPDEEDPEDTPQRYERLKEVVGILDGMLENQDYVAGRNLTIADLSIIASIIAIQVLLLFFFSTCYLNTHIFHC